MGIENQMEEVKSDAENLNEFSQGRTKKITSDDFQKQSVLHQDEDVKLNDSAEEIPPIDGCEDSVLTKEALNISEAYIISPEKKLTDSDLVEIANEVHLFKHQYPFEKRRKWS